MMQTIENFLAILSYTIIVYIHIQLIRNIVNFILPMMLKFVSFNSPPISPNSISTVLLCFWLLSLGISNVWACRVGFCVHNIVRFTYAVIFKILSFRRLNNILLCTQTPHFYHSCLLINKQVGSFYRMTNVGIKIRI